ncbi:glycosyltransferase family 4 protein [Halomonas sp. M5N1S17]|uniref:glycosyltransferase family 4 protein n=1 Tax=Halomonas alkalisoli TaxID=2907158 RepID=UPI001F161690|nr:glycosyltransferase family 4 protein [Halomonas alkalisoli]MCE9664019.1 glycosyltransferase family 4 protein [Halomonas alkalisoli]
MIIRLLAVLPFFPAPGSIGNTGGTISNLNMLRVLAREYSVTVISFDGTAQVTDFSNEPFRVVIRPAPAWRVPQLIRHWLDFVRKEVNAAIEHEDAPDAIMATTSTLAAFDVCPSATARIAIVRAYENFGLLCPWVPVRQRINLGKQATVRRFQDRRLMRRSDAVLTNSNFMRSAISSRFRMDQHKIYVLKQACDVVPSVVSTPRSTVGFVTRGPEKGLSFVLKLALRSPDLRYLIYGQSRDLPDTLPENVAWHGWSSDRDAMFSSAALWLVPSLWAEPFGRVSIEAQGADRAVLVASTGGLPETAFDPRYRIEGFDEEEWLTRMRSLLVIPNDKLELNGKLIRSLFSSQEHDAKVLDAVNHVLGEKEKHSR